MPRNIHPDPFIVRPPDEIIQSIDLRNLNRSLANKYADGHVVTDDDLQIMGLNLWMSLGVQESFDSALKDSQGAILPIIIESDKAEVQALPWETLYHPVYGFIGKNSDFTLTRRIVGEKPAQENLDKGPLRVLLFTSLPDNVDAERGRLNVEEEQAQVQEALLPRIASGVVQLEMPDDGRFSTLKELLKRFDPHVLFLSGHGKFHHEPHADEAYGMFWFESEAGDGEAIRDEDIARALSETRVQAVILSACESGKTASDYLSNGLMQRISAAGIPHVIGMRESILDIAGIQFARTLCDALAGQERMDVAVQSARAAIQQAKDERGQWCLPMAISPNPQSQLIDWDFEPQVIQPQRINQRLNNVSLPARFVGRRAEMRRYKIKLTQGALHSLLITGAGGQGKTALAGKLALDMQKARGDGLFAWSANSEKSWRDFELEMGQTLDQPRVERYDKFMPTAENEVDRAKFMLDLLMEQFNGRVILFFDNLETLQDADLLAVKNATVAAWMQAARGKDGVTVFATSRWQISDWDSEHLMLARANYGDFLQIAAMKNLPIRREQMRRVYDALGGNIRGLEFFAAAAQNMDDENAEEAFLQTLEQTKSELQANMAIAEIFKRLPADAKKLLARLPAYHEAVPKEGLLKLGQDFPDAETLLERLIAVSLLEASYNSHWNVTEYQCAPMVTDWMNENGLVDNSSEWLNVVADYHLLLFEYEYKILSQAVTTHHALSRAGRHTEADNLTLGYIVEPMTRAGFYTTLLNEWLPRICESQDLKTRGGALNQMGKLNLQSGNYKTALPYCEQSLALMEQIGDKQGEGIVLNNIGTIYMAQGSYETALTHLKQALIVRQQVNDKMGEGQSLNNISQIYIAWGDYETAFSHLKQSLTIRQQIGDKQGEGTTLGNIGEIYQIQGDYETAIAYFKQSLAIVQQVGNKEVEGNMLGSIAVNYLSQGVYEAALSYIKGSLAIMKQIDSKAGEGRVLSIFGNIYLAQGDYDSALIYLKQSLGIQQQIGDKEGEGSTLNAISTIYHRQGDYETGLPYLERLLAIQQQIGDKKGESTTLNNIGKIYDAQGNYETALSYLKQSLTIRQQIDDKQGEGTALDNIGSIYQAQNDYETALSYFTQSLTIRQQLGDKQSEGMVLNNISHIYFVLGNYEMALPYIKQSLIISKQLDNKARLCEIFFNMGNMYMKNKQFQEAANSWVTSYVIAKQINNAEILQALMDLAPQIGLKEGLEDWERLVQDLERAKQFVHAFIKSVREKNEKTEKFVEVASEMVEDPRISPVYQKLAKVLLEFMSGTKNLDLDGLPEDIKEILQGELDNEQRNNKKSYEQIK